MHTLEGLQHARFWAQEYATLDPDSSAPAETMPVCVIPALLSDEEIKQCHAAAAELGGADPFAGGGLCEALSGRSHDVGYSDEHIATYLHKDSYLQVCCIVSCSLGWVSYLACMPHAA